MTTSAPTNNPGAARLAAAGPPVVKRRISRNPPPPDAARARELISRILTCLKPYKSYYLLGATFGLLAVGLEVITPIFSQRIIDSAIPSGDPWEVVHWAMIWGVVMLFSLTLDSMQIRTTHRGGEMVLSDLRMAVYEKLQRLPMAYYDRTPLGKILTHGGSDIDTMRHTVVTGLNTAILNATLMIGAGIMIAWTEWRMFVALAILLPVLGGLNRMYKIMAGNAHDTAHKTYTRVASNLAENITGVRVVAAFNRQEENLAAFNTLQSDNTSNNVRVGHLNGIYQPLLEFVKFAGQVIVLGYGGVRVLRGELTAGAVVAVFFYWDYFMRPAINLGTFYGQLMMGLAAADKVFLLLDEPEGPPAQEGEKGPRIQGRIDFEDVGFGYDPERPVLKNVNFHAPAGSTVALVGHTGSGKSSLILLLARFYQYQQGRILIDGEDIQQLPLDHYRRQIGLVLQLNFLFSGTVMDNMRYPRPDASDEEVYEAARQLDLHDTFMALPKGYETEVGERGGAVSLGMRQLICFTRVLVANPRIFLLDEATSSIDTVTEQKIQAALAKLTRNRTTLVVAHRLSTIVHADLILVLDEGHIVESGSHAELLAKGGIYATMFSNFVPDGNP